VKLAIVVQRYGADISGGAELHARYVAEHLATHARVTVLTTCARDYVTWHDEYPPGADTVNGIPVHRFPVDRERDVKVFAARSERVFEQEHSWLDEAKWIDAEGPTSRALIHHINATRADVDYFLFFSYRYYHAYHGARTVPAKAILVPTAERDHTIGLSIFHPVFRGVRAVMYNSPEERRMIQAAANNRDVPGVVVGIGSAIPPASQLQPERFRRKYGVTGRFALYVGRIDQNKGCKELFTYFLQALPALPKGLGLVLIGKEILPIPDHPRITHLGFLDDQDKFDALAASDLLIMPSYYESLSMVALEAWALGKPVLANGKCEVLRGQCVRSRAGLYYDNQAEFVETLRAIADSRTLNAALGANGRTFFDRHYSWPVIEGKYLDMLHRLEAARPSATAPQTRSMEPEPGWFARRRRILPPADEILSALPFGPVGDVGHAAGGFPSAPDSAQYSPNVDVKAVS